MKSWLRIGGSCAALWTAIAACGGGGATEEAPESGVTPEAGFQPDHGQGHDAGDAGDASRRRDAGGKDGSVAHDARTEAASEAGTDAGIGTGTCTGDAGTSDSCYAIVCTTAVHTLQDNRDRLVADLAKRKCTDSCTLWAALNEAERYIFLMDTAYLGAPASLLYPPGSTKLDTALDHAVALYSINGPDAGQGILFNGLGGNDYNRIYLGFDPLAQCVMRNFMIANPSQTKGYNAWVKSDDLGGPHAPFTERDMIAWFRAIFDPQTQGPQFHFWAVDSDFTQTGLNQRLGVCGVTDPSVTELTIAFDTVHDSNPLGKYGSDGASKGGFGWQIVDQFVGISADWSYMPSGCAKSAPLNTSVTGGGTFNGMGPSQDGSVCTSPSLGDAGSCP